MNRRSVCLRNRIPWLSQFLRMMKIALVFVFLSVSSLFASVNAQRVSIELKNVSLREIFEQVKKQTGMSFMYSNDDIRHLQKRDFKMTDADVETIMEACLKDTGLTFEVVDEVVIVKPAVQVMNSVPQKKMVLSGTVKDNRGDVMPGVTVRIKGTTLGVATDIDGKWNLEIPEMNDVVLVFSFVGMESQEIEPGNRTVIDVVMEVAKENLEEVVVTGIFKRNKEGFTGSATQVSGDEIKKMTAGNVLKALEMLDPGFRMNTSNLAGSNPNAIPDFQMRGQASLGN